MWVAFFQGMGIGTSVTQWRVLFIILLAVATLPWELRADITLCPGVFASLASTPYLQNFSDRSILDVDRLVADFKARFGEPPTEVYVVGSLVKEGGEPSRESDIDLVFVVPKSVLARFPNLARDQKFNGPGFEFFKSINPGRVDPSIRGIGLGENEAFMMGTEGPIPKAGMLDPFFLTSPPKDPGGETRRVWPETPG